MSLNQNVDVSTAGEKKYQSKNSLQQKQTTKVTTTRTMPLNID